MATEKIAQMWEPPFRMKKEVSVEKSSSVASARRWILFVIVWLLITAAMIDTYLLFQNKRIGAQLKKIDSIIEEKVGPPRQTQ